MPPPSGSPRRADSQPDAPSLGPDPPVQPAPPLHEQTVVPGTPPRDVALEADPTAVLQPDARAASPSPPPATLAADPAGLTAAPSSSQPAAPSTDEVVVGAAAKQGGGELVLHDAALKGDAAVLFADYRERLVANNAGALAKLDAMQRAIVVRNFSLVVPERRAGCVGAGSMLFFCLC